jgi:hypothetical protein
MKVRKAGMKVRKAGMKVRKAGSGKSEGGRRHFTKLKWRQTPRRPE